MSVHLILASGSATRANLLRQAGLAIRTIVPGVDEEAIKRSRKAEQMTSSQIAERLAEAKARSVTQSYQADFVLGCDQILDCEGEIFSKPTNQDECLEQLLSLSARTHTLLSAAVIYHESQPVWRHVGTVHLKMREISQAFAKDYVARNWESIQHSVGGYKLEEEGAQLFTAVQGDYFHVLGLPLLEVLGYLRATGHIRS